MDDNKISKFIQDELTLFLRIESKYIQLDTEFESFPTWDSFSALQLLIAIEATYKVKLDPGRMFTCKTVSDLIDYVEALKN